MFRKPVKHTSENYLRSTSFSARFFATRLEAYFTPYDDCTQKIMNEIHAAKSSIVIQAYFFTCKSIANAISKAHKNGIDVKVLLDRSQLKYEDSAYEQLKKDGVPVWRDSTKGLAHSKVMIIDDKVVITGSFNLTRAAQDKNIENLNIIEDGEFVKLYNDNFERRLSLAKRMH